MIELTKDYIDNLKDIITEKDDTKIKEILNELYPADIAELYQELSLQEAIYLYLLMDGEKAADVLMELDEEDRHKLLKELPNELIAKRFVEIRRRYRRRFDGYRNDRGERELEYAQVYRRDAQASRRHG